MKVKIGPYKNWFGPYQLAEVLCFWAKKEKDEYGFPRKPDWVHNFGEWIAHGKVLPEPKVGEIHSWDEDRHNTLLYKLLLWIDSFKRRKIQVRIDRYDTWSMDHTLAYIIVPMLEQLKETKHGAPFVDDKDVPKELKSTSAPPKENEWDTDENHFKRWDYVLDEMIWSFKQKVTDHWESQYYTDTGETKMVKEEDGNYRMVESGIDIDRKGLEAHQKRMSNGFRLFGKYYENLWN